MAEHPERGIIEAAGGLVWRESERGREVAVIFRARRRDWTLPKGHLKPGETWQQAAVREVMEETGCSVRLGDFAGAVTYLVHGSPKVVLYWHMSRDGSCSQIFDSGEVERVVWLTVPEALEKLDYENERAFLRRVTGS